jgi:hypothetical protein
LGTKLDFPNSRTCKYLKRMVGDRGIEPLASTV